jgi:hypothetical protein
MYGFARSSMLRLRILLYAKFWSKYRLLLTSILLLDLRYLVYMYLLLLYKL